MSRLLTLLLLYRAGYFVGKNISLERLIADIVLQLLSYVAQTEREFICRRQAEDIAVAKANGVRFDRKPVPRPPDFEVLRESWRRGEVSAREAGRHLGITHRTFLLWANEDLG